MARTKKLPIVISFMTTYELLNNQKSPDAFSLYSFYYMKARLDETNQPYSTLKYTAKMLGWGEKRLLKAKKVLKNLKLIEDIKSGERWYIKVKYIWTKDTIEKLISTTQQKGVLDIEKDKVISTTPQKDVLPFKEHTLSDNNSNTLSDNYFAKSNSPKPTTANSELGDAKLDNPDRREELDNNHLANSDVLEKYLTGDELVEIMLNLGVEKNHIRQALDDCLRFYGGNPQKGKILIWLGKVSNYSKFIKGRIRQI